MSSRPMRRLCISWYASSASRRSSYSTKANLSKPVRRLLHLAAPLQGELTVCCSRSGEPGCRSERAGHSCSDWPLSVLSKLAGARQGGRLFASRAQLSSNLMPHQEEAARPMRARGGSTSSPTARSMGGGDEGAGTRGATSESRTRDRGSDGDDEDTWR